MVDHLAVIEGRIGDAIQGGGVSGRRLRTTVP